jgi:hypothetical protein
MYWIFVQKSIGLVYAVRLTYVSIDDVMLCMDGPYSNPPAWVDEVL